MPSCLNWKFPGDFPVFVRVSGFDALCCTGTSPRSISPSNTMHGRGNHARSGMWMVPSSDSTLNESSQSRGSFVQNSISISCCSPGATDWGSVMSLKHAPFGGRKRTRCTRWLRLKIVNRMT
eukprot:gene17630-biopygen17838